MYVTVPDKAHANYTFHNNTISPMSYSGSGSLLLEHVGDQEYGSFRTYASAPIPDTPSIPAGRNYTDTVKASTSAGVGSGDYSTRATISRDGGTSNGYAFRQDTSLWSVIR